MRRFELAGEPRRFWEVQVLGSSVQMRWGELDKPPSTFHRTFPDDAAAEVFAERQIIAQRERGYVETARPAWMAARPPEVAAERHQRFEWAPTNVRRFVEVHQEELKVTVRGGRIVGSADVPDRDKFDVQNYPTIAAASAGFDERCAEVREQGGIPVEPEPTHAVQENAELEAGCEASPDDPAPWAVYADWLIGHGDARGEIAALHLAGQSAQAKRALGAHMHELCGIDSGKLVLEFRHGFAVHATIWIERDAPDLLEDVTRQFLVSPMARFVESLRFGLAGQGDENDWAPTIHAVASSPRAPHIRALYFNHYDSDDGELSWTPYGDFSGVWDKLPALEVLHVRSGAGGTLGATALPNLRTLIRESGGLGQAEIDELLAIRAPKLEHLEIWFGAANYGAEGELSSLRPVLDGTAYPALRHLGIVNCEFVDAAIPELARSKILPQLTSLDLSKGVMARTATASLVEHAAAFRHLASIDLDENMLLADEMAQIRAVLDNVIPGDQRDRDYDANDEQELGRYAAVGE